MAGRKAVREAQVIGGYSGDGATRQEGTSSRRREEKSFWHRSMKYECQLGQTQLPCLICRSNEEQGGSNPFHSWHWMWKNKYCFLTGLLKSAKAIQTHLRTSI